MNRDLNPKPGIVYHCIPVKAEGDCIRASDNYGTEPTPEMRERLGLPPEGKFPLVFASAYFAKALAFGLQGGLQEKILNAQIEGSSGELVLACDRDRLMSRKRDITVYEISDTNFVPFEGNDQCVSAMPVPFSETRVALHAKSAEDLMRAGLQILSLREDFAEARPAFDAAMEDGRGIYPFMREKLRDGSLVWENAARNINPDPALAKILGVSLAPVAAQKPAMPRF